MSIIADIKKAKAEYEDHVATHKCRAGQCEKRAEMLQAWFGTAGMWALEPDDDQRQRDHFNRNLRPAAAL
jgi:hypothetical protein